MADENNIGSSLLEKEIEGTDEMIQDITHKIELLESQRARLIYIAGVFAKALKDANEAPKQGEMELVESDTETKS